MTRTSHRLVLGAGGVLGAAWTIGALCALEEVEGFDPRAADVIVGTSAGSILGALLGAGVRPDRCAITSSGFPSTASSTTTSRAPVAPPRAGRVSASDRRPCCGALPGIHCR